MSGFIATPTMQDIESLHEYLKQLEERIRVLEAREALREEAARADAEEQRRLYEQDEYFWVNVGTGVRPVTFPPPTQP